MSDPDLDPATGLLRNRLGLTDAGELERVEALVAYHAEIRLYTERLSFERYDLAACNRCIGGRFEDIYVWAGELRTVNIVKGNAPFARVQHLRTAAEEVFGRLARDNYLRGLDAKDFASGAGRLFADINTLHPFREGYCRAQRVFLQLVATMPAISCVGRTSTARRTSSVSEAAMADPDAFAPLILGTLVLLTARLSPTELRLAHEDPPEFGLSAAQLDVTPAPVRRTGRCGCRSRV